MKQRLRIAVIAALAPCAGGLLEAAAPPERSLAFVGATLIDGNGGAPLEGAVVVVTGQRIAAVGPRGKVQPPKGAQIVDAAGKFLLPGFIDTNVHLSLYGVTTPERYETLVRYQPRQTEVVLEAS